MLLDRDARAGYEFLWSHGMIPDEMRLTIINGCNFEDYSFANSDHDMTESCNNAITEAKRIVGDYIDDSYMIADVCHPSIVEQELRLRKMATKPSLGVDVCINYETFFYLNLPEV